MTASSVSVKCLECGKTFKVRAGNYDPECPKCGGVDIELN